MHKPTRTAGKVTDVFGVDGFAQYVDPNGKQLDEPILKLDTDDAFVAADEDDWIKLEDTEAKFYDLVRSSVSAFVVGALQTAKTSGVGSVHVAATLIAAALERQAKVLNVVARKSLVDAEKAKEASS